MKNITKIVSMISKKQMMANQRNSKKGGVKTESGKEISKYNAVKHGILCKESLLEDEDSEAFVQLKEGLFLELDPIGELEIVLVDRIIANIWRLRRSLYVEKEAMQYSKIRARDEEALLDFTRGQAEKRSIRDMIGNESIVLIQRYETTIERSLFKTLHELQRIQATKRGEVSIGSVSIDVNSD
jgi:hypothetical protein